MPLFSLGPFLKSSVERKKAFEIFSQSQASLNFIEVILQPGRPNGKYMSSLLQLSGSISILGTISIQQPSPKGEGMGLRLKLAEDGGRNWHDG
jgi:hypothetical protein